MRTSKQSIRQRLTTPLIGYGIVLLFLACFLLLLWTLTILVRVVAG
ncbi:hypothetical protein [Gordonibacter massiliensis (ex Traore et al. 2017)]|uniref:Uncharacterized protein n=1 Tax=Gordonibacter massiliensis (ex Traore et al. 2017) TaxID=1841863 RepID=A0A842J894_9ACTN|nr:hypothetical protein [Gordonibacter massiliensis (ex Traore et al. 2017)]MBC2887947.1 hypothetical protein [Gordonibacter massiliensis (ex Traore et al. 2017)]